MVRIRPIRAARHVDHARVGPCRRRGDAAWTFSGGKMCWLASRSAPRGRTRSWRARPTSPLIRRIRATGSSSISTRHRRTRKVWSSSPRISTSSSPRIRLAATASVSSTSSIVATSSCWATFSRGGRSPIHDSRRFRRCLPARAGLHPGRGRLAVRRALNRRPGWVHRANRHGEWPADHRLGEDVVHSR